MTEQTKQMIGAELNLIRIVADAIREIGSVPSGQLYAYLMGHMSLSQYQSIIGTLKKAELVRESNNVLVWIGPKE